MKYIKTYETSSKDIKVGDKVIFFNPHEKDIPRQWHGYFGEVVASNAMGGTDFKVRLFHNPEPDDPYFFNNKDNTTWIGARYLRKYDTDENFYKAIEQIKFEKEAKKYNL